MAQDRTSSHPKHSEGSDSRVKDQTRKPADSSVGGSDMPRDERADEASGKKNQVIEELHETFDPGEKFPMDPEDSGPKRSQKQPGQALDAPRTEADGGA
ncbi:hypothetical protein [Rhodobaculum claviforme]|uniref:hypothetical protein n=1 Tax=Rhodobaculum claviforme TaxID=1549854 RepID=UPI001912F287|nr:hypothetical protein [Rhodobaculum claviforme]